MVELILPWGPSINHYWVQGRGHTYISREGRTFRDAVGWECRAKRVKPLPGRLGVVIRACPPNKRRIDIDNRVKAVLDAMQHAGVYADDSQIDDLRIYRGPVIKGGALHVQVIELQQKARETGPFAASPNLAN